jgi:eukaryotic-like serine/threonine-protein kinase
MNAPHHSNPWIGRSIGDRQRYHLDRPLGGGGMGDVFLATDTRIGQQVALKLLKDNLVESPEMRQRFEHEIGICAALHNEHIVKIMDSGVTPEGYPFYVMEYLRGLTLGELLRNEQRLDVDRTVNIISQVCNGLLLAHQGVDLPNGEHTEAVVHRDLKPDNIFIQPTDLGEWVKIVDFGIAKIRYKSYQPQTLTHTFLGTLRYASPEQMMGDRDLDARSDIYSLGVILYEMLSGADPFGLKIQSRHVSEASWIIAHTRDRPISLTAQPGCEHLSPALDAVTLRCLEKNPDLRFGSVAELNLALKAAISAPQTSSDRSTGDPIVQPHPGADKETIDRVIAIPDPISSTPSPNSAQAKTDFRPRAEPNPILPSPSPSPVREKTNFQPRPEPDPTPLSLLPNPARAKPPLPWLKLAIGALVGLGAATGIYLFTKVPSPEVLLSDAITLVNEDKFPAAIESARKIPQNSPLHQQAQTLGADVAQLSEAIKLANRGDLVQAIKLAQTISPQSPISTKVQAYIKEWGKV